jgi:hypothetical protein
MVGPPCSNYGVGWVLIIVWITSKLGSYPLLGVIHKQTQKRERWRDYASEGLKVMDVDWLVAVGNDKVRENTKGIYRC